MPNHVINLIGAPREVLAALQRPLTDEEKAADAGFPIHDPDRLIVDFGLVIPEPENIEKGACSGPRNATRVNGNLIHLDGSVCWWDWNVKNWGTKWNAYDTDQGEGVIEFQTAWAHPYPVLRALSKRFPDALIHVKYADEDLGNNCANYTVLNGNEDFSEDIVTNGEAIRFACELWGYDPAEFLAQKEEA